MRIKKEKDTALEKFKDSIEEKIVMKGESVNIHDTPLLDLNSHFSGERCLASPGGHLMQIYYVLD
jgi:hypothetical protein